jgi:hypothetical protein
VANRPGYPGGDWCNHSGKCATNARSLAVAHLPGVKRASDARKLTYNDMWVLECWGVANSTTSMIQVS